jgi:uncharacterized protein (TIGR02300 family)
MKRTWHWQAAKRPCRTEDNLAKPEWGQKRACPGCGSRFYDLLRDPITCPSCGATVAPTAFSKTRRSRSVAAKAAAKSAVVVEAAATATVANVPVDDEATGIVADDDNDEVIGIITDDDDDDDDDLIEDASELGEDENDVSVVVEAGENDGADDR